MGNGAGGEDEGAGAGEGTGDGEGNGEGAEAGVTFLSLTDRRRGRRLFFGCVRAVRGAAAGAGVCVSA